MLTPLNGYCRDPDSPKFGYCITSSLLISPQYHSASRMVVSLRLDRLSRLATAPTSPGPWPKPIVVIVLLQQKQKRFKKVFFFVCVFVSHLKLSQREDDHIIVITLYQKQPTGSIKK